jgi:hypothetical protein
MSESTITTIILGGFGLIITFVFSLFNFKLSKDRMNKELFTEFNSRYNKLNNSLYNIVNKCDTLDSVEKDEKLKNDLIDFFNLCAEEYYWHKKNRIDTLIWESWSVGMNNWYKYPVIQEVWEKEIKEFGCKCYYIKDKNDFFFEMRKI